MLTLDQRKFMFSKQSMHQAILLISIRKMVCGDKDSLLPKVTLIHHVKHAQDVIDQRLDLVEILSILSLDQIRLIKSVRQFGMFLIEVESHTQISDAQEVHQLWFNRLMIPSTMPILIHGYGSNQPMLWEELTDSEMLDHGLLTKEQEKTSLNQAWNQTLTCLLMIMLMLSTPPKITLLGYQMAHKPDGLELKAEPEIWLTQVVLSQMFSLSQTHKLMY
jgi:hypothetical protein